MNAPATLPPRPLVKRWQLGDSITTPDGIRWGIRRIQADGTVVLESLNTMNRAIWWTTTIAQLGEKNR